MKRLVILLATGAVLMAGTTSSLAQFVTNGPTITSTPVSASTPTDWGITANNNISTTGNDNAGNTPEYLTFSQANGGVGLTLTEVELSFTSSLTTTMSITNNALFPENNVKVFTDTEIFVDDIGDNFSSSPYITENSAKYTFASIPGLGGTASSPLESGTGLSGNIIFTASSILTEFTGIGTFNLGVSTYTTTGLQNANGNTASGQVADAGLTGTVTYIYAIVPEPSTIGLLALGCGALPFLRRQRQ